MSVHPVTAIASDDHPAMHLDAVAVDLGGKRIVDGVDLDVAAGEWVGLIGPNGAGKTTLLRAIAGQVPHAGGLTVGSRDPAHESKRALARLIGVVPQRPAVPPGMTVGDYVLLGRTPYIPYLGVESPDDVVVVADVLHRLELAEFSDRLLTSLSGGELQRAVLARALAQEAPVLLLDEPTSALDVGHQQHVLELVDDLRRERGLAVLTAMHDLTVAGQFADRLVLLAGGRCVATGTAREVLTEGTIEAHYAAHVRVIEDPAGGVVLVPTRRREPPAVDARATGA